MGRHHFERPQSPNVFTSITVNAEIYRDEILDPRVKSFKDAIEYLRDFILINGLRVLLSSVLQSAPSRAAETLPTEIFLDSTLSLTQITTCERPVYHCLEIYHVDINSFIYVEGLV